MRHCRLPLTLLTALLLAAVPAAAATGPKAEAATVAATSSASTPTLKAGARGVAVVRVQKDLGIRQSGVFHAATVSAVKSFQRSHRISATGVVGPFTWAALIRVEKAVAAAKADFAKRRAAANGQLTVWRGRIADPSSFLTPLPAADLRLLLGRFDAARARLDAAAAAVAKAGTLAQVRAQNGWPARASDAAFVIRWEADAVSIVRPYIFTNSTVHHLDYIESQKDDDVYVSPEAESAARQRVLKAAEAWRAAMAPSALAMLNTDPLSAGAKGRAEAFKASMMALGLSTTPLTKAYNDAFDDYFRVIFPFG